MDTNLALLQLMWTILNGSFLQSCGAIFPALQANECTLQESHRIWATFRHGVTITTHSDPKEAYHFYKKRFKIETMFSNKKSRGFRIHKSHLSESKRLATKLGMKKKIGLNYQPVG